MSPLTQISPSSPARTRGAPSQRAIGSSRTSINATSTPGAAWKAYVAVREAGVLVRPLLAGFAISPPLTITREEIGILADGVRSGLDSLAGTLS